MPDDLTNLMGDDADARIGISLPTDADLQTISDLANEQLRLQDEVEAAEERLKSLKEQLRSIERGKLPEALSRFRLTHFGIEGGGEISVKDEVYAGITEDHRAEAFRWLETSGNDDIIKNEVSLNFGKGQDDQASDLIDLLNERGYSFDRKRAVHPQTLKAFVRHALEEGVPIPFDTFSIHVDKVAKIKLKKKKETA